MGELPRQSLVRRAIAALTLVTVPSACAQGVATAELEPYELVEPDDGADGLAGPDEHSDETDERPLNEDDGEPDASLADGEPPTPDDEHGEGDIDAGTAEPDASEPSGPTGDACLGTTSCERPWDLGSVAGDVSGASLTASAHTSMFYKFRVREDDHMPSLIGGRRLRVTASLLTPGADFDLYLYASGAGCSTLSDTSATIFSEYVEAVWNDVQPGDTGRDVIIEVRYRDGVCDESHPFTLSITGN